MVTTRMPVVWMIDPDGDKRGQIVYRRLTAIPRYCDVGTWRVEAALTPNHARAAEAGWRIIIDDVSGIYGGNVAEAEIKMAGREQRLVLSGEDDMFWLRDSLAWPLPTAPVGSQTQAYDVRTGKASTVIRAYVAANRGPTAHAARQIPGLTLAADPLLGDTVTGRARFTQLLDLLRGLAITGGVGFRMAASIGPNFTFEVYEPPDLFGMARFGLTLGNVKSVRWRLTAPKATYVVGGGRGEETARTFVSATDLGGESLWGRREDFYDYRSASATDGNAELVEGTQRRLDEQAQTELVEVEPKDTARLQFGTGYQLGSQITVDVYGGTVVFAVIREVELTVDRTARGNGPVRTVTPRIGDVGATATSRQMLAIRDALARVSNLERG